MSSRISIRSLFCICLLLVCLVSSPAFAQEVKATFAPSVSASAVPEQARFLASSEVVQMRLEVFTASGTRLFDSDLKAGNLFDWNWQDQQGQRLADGSYRCLLTVKDTAGRESQRQGLLLVQAGEATWQTPEQAEATLRTTNPSGTTERIEFFTTVPNKAELPAAVLAHDGSQGRLMTSNGALSIRTGDFFASKDQEQVRLTPDGKLGLGVTAPQAKLDVAGPIRTSEGIVFPDGSVQTTAYVASGRSLNERSSLNRDAQGRTVTEPDDKAGGPLKGLRLAPSVTTAGRLAKFDDNAGTLTNSVVTELASGRVGVSNPNPNYTVEVGNSAAGEISTIVTNANSATNAFAGIGVRNGAQPADTFRLLALGTNWASTGAFVQDAGVLQAAANLSGGISLLAANANGAIRFYAGGQSERMRISPSGNVGIGTATPSALLDLQRQGAGNDLQLTIFGAGNVPNIDWRKANGTAAAPTAVSNDSILASMTFQGHTGGGFATGAKIEAVASETWSGSAQGTRLRFSTVANGATTLSERMRIDSDGNVGIGTINPETKLHVSGSDNNGSTATLIITSGSQNMLLDGNEIDSVNTDLNLNHNTNQNVILANGGGKVGIGTTTPNRRLEIIEGSGSIPQLRLKGNGATDKVFDFWVGNSALWIQEFDQAGTLLGTHLAIDGGSGNVGIGKTNPGTKLDVNGTTRTEILQITGGSDLSEQFDINEASVAGENLLPAPVQPGMVVSIDPTKPGELVLSSQAHDRKVAGIISGAGGVKPGMMMGQSGSIADGKHPVALTGRVYCWADASNGPINPGDLLTSSNTPGHAMKVADHQQAQGAIIGKAMTSLKEGKGLVLVLVTLQ